MSPEHGPGPQHTGKGKSASNAERGAYYEKNLLPAFRAAETTPATKADKLAYYQNNLGNDRIGTDAATGQEAPAQTSGEATQAEAPTPASTERPDAPRPTEQGEQNERQEDGAAILAENIDRVAQEAGPEGVQAYMESLLAPESAESAPRAEREALFSMLAAAQKERVLSGAIASAERNDAAQRGGKVAAAEKTKDSHAKAKLRTADFGAKYDAMRRGRIDSRTLNEKSSAISYEMSGFVNGQLQQDHDVLARSSVEQANGLQTLAVELQFAQSHETALNEALKTLQPGYEGDAKDILGTIDADITKQLSLDLADAVRGARETGQNPAEAVAVLRDERLQPRGETTIYSLAQETHARHAELVRARQVLDEQQGEITRAVAAFRRAGDAYASVRDTGELAPLGAAQANSIRAINQSLNRIQEARRRILA